MKSFLYLLPIVLVFAVVGLSGYIRLAPSNPEVWHIDPTDPDLRPGDGRFLLRDGGDAPSPVFDAAPETVMARLAEIADATARTRVLAGDPGQAHMTFVTRSRLMAFPDYTSVKAVADGQGQTKLVVYARLRFGQRDFGVNRARVEDWVAQLQADPAL